MSFLASLPKGDESKKRKVAKAGTAKGDDAEKDKVVLGGLEVALGICRKLESFTEESFLTPGDNKFGKKLLDSQSLYDANNPG